MYVLKSLEKCVCYCRNSILDNSINFSSIASCLHFIDWISRQSKKKKNKIIMKLDFEFFE